jgi:transposase
MMCGCQHVGASIGYGMCIDSPAFDPAQLSRASSVIQAHGSSPHPALKNTVRSGRHCTWYDRKTRRVRDLSCGDRRIYLDLEIRRVACRRCAAVRQERLEFLADSPFYTKRFAFFVGRRCRASTIQDVARETHLNWKRSALEMQYMQEQLPRGHGAASSA